MWFCCYLKKWKQSAYCHITGGCNNLNQGSAADLDRDKEQYIRPFDSSETWCSWGDYCCHTAYGAVLCLLCCSVVDGASNPMQSAFITCDSPGNTLPFRERGTRLYNFIWAQESVQILSRFLFNAIISNSLRPSDITLRHHVFIFQKLFSVMRRKSK